MTARRFALASGSHVRVELDVVITAEFRELREVRLSTAFDKAAAGGPAILKPDEARLIAAALVAAADEADSVSRRSNKP